MYFHHQILAIDLHLCIDNQGLGLVHTVHYQGGCSQMNLTLYILYTHTHYTYIYI
ncbi:hypothetical protein HanXRQr2_Chr13g0589021 [Helianthus annuus]|uniref:Uncharacterized protein n=1 Tax=Helianthus annuus TaxID=4232 RepID=A0A9K3EHR8_HELAN|nr:hypothetical protein HanXRQr2_Chr13g0589021 [Helianthus annuus]